jgi:hypothetical protein
MMMRLVVRTLAATVALAFSLSAGAEDIDTRFHQIKLADHRDAVVAFMGRPDAEVQFNTLGLRRSRLRWNVQTESYVVIFVLDRVIMTKKCESTTDC